MSIKKFFKENSLLDASYEAVSKEVELATDMTALARRLSAGKESRAGKATAWIKRLNIELGRVEDLKRTSMLDHLDGKLSAEEYKRLRKSCSMEGKSLKARIAELRKEQKQLGETLTEKAPFF